VITVALTIAAQTVVFLVALFKMHGDSMRKIGELDTKVDAMWRAYTSDDRRHRPSRFSQ